MRTRLVAVLAAGTTLAIAAPAAAHVERTAYWPDPAPDNSAQPPAGGAVPQARSLASATDKRAPGTTRVVCQSDSLARLKDSIATATTKGFSDRPTEPLRKLSGKDAKSLLATNKALFAAC